MANPTVTNTYVDGSKLVSADINQNFTDCVNAVTDGSKDLSIASMAVAGNASCNFIINSSSTISVYPVSLSKCVGTRVEYKDSLTITVKSGYYWINNKVQQLVSDTDWSLTFDTGVAGDDWYYLYLADVAGTLTPVASLTSPTNFWDTTLAGGTYDTNLYLCAFENRIAAGVAQFSQCGNQVLQFNNTINTTTQSGTSYTSKGVTSLKPATAMQSTVLLYSDMVNSAVGYFSLDGTLDYFQVFTYNTGSDTPLTQMVIPSITPIFLKSGHAGNTITISYIGWYDRWMI